MKSTIQWAALALMAAVSGAVYAQQPPQDVPPDHWAYQAVQDLASKGLVLGYPDGKFLGNRTLTRYEMATIIERVLEFLDKQVDQKIAAIPPPPTPPAANTTPQVTQDDLDEIRRLVDEFKVQLTVIGSDLDKAKADIAELQGLKDQVNTLNSKVDDLNKHVDTLDHQVSDLKQLKFTGFIQDRWESVSTLTNQASIFSSPAALASGDNDHFFVRRGRIKITHTTDQSDYVLQLDASGDNAVSLKDAYTTWKLGRPLAGTAQPAFWFGQFNTPFGYEIERPDPDNEFLERSYAENVLFPNERDRGVRFISGLGPKLTFDTAILNGGAINQPSKDDRFKDWTARLKGTIAPWWHLGVSSYVGKAQEPAVPGVAATPGTIDYPNNDQNTPVFVPGKAAVAAIPGYNSTRDRFGADTQIQLSGGTLRGEGYTGKQPNAVGDPLMPQNKIYGWYGSYVYNFTKKDIAGLRFDTYDSNKDAGGNTVSRWNAVLDHNINKNMRLSASYEWYPSVPTGYLSRPLWRIQAQHAF